MTTYTIRVDEALTAEHAISLACERFNQLYDDGTIISATPVSPFDLDTVVDSFDVKFDITGSTYIGPNTSEQQAVDVQIERLLDATSTLLAAVFVQQILDGRL
jgi:hypothetical protein